MDYNIHMNKNNHGFTLIELIVVMAVFAILVAIAAPSYTAFTDSSRRASQVNVFNGSLSYARSEAIKRNSTVSVCARSAGAETCSGLNNWKDGWLVFDDINNNGLFAAPDTLLRVFDPTTSGSTITKKVAPYTVTYRGSGFISAASEFKYCSGGSRATDARAIIVSKTGRSRLSIDTDSNKIHEDGSGADLICP